MSRLLLPILLCLSVLLVPQVSARADVVCVVEGETLNVVLTVPVVPVTLVRSGDEFVVVNGSEDADCGTPAPTVDSVNGIHVTDLRRGSTTLSIDLTGGPFESSGGAKLRVDIDLGDGTSDAVVVVGSSLAEHITVADAGIDLRAGSDPGPHVLLEGVERVVVRAGGGGDTIDAGADPSSRRVELRGEDGADTLIGGAGADLLAGGSGGDDLRGADGDDVLRGGPGADALEGGAGDDVVDGGEGDDDEAGGAGDDVFDQGSAAEGADELDGEDGTDAVAYDLRSADLTVVLDGSGPSGEAGEGDSIASIETALTGAGDDVVTGGSGADVLHGGAGTDVLVGGGGDDEIFGGPGTDAMSGGPGADTASYFDAPGPVTADLADGVSRIMGEEDTLQGIEHLKGGRHGDTLRGDQGANELAGRGGADRLVGRDGDDRLEGGTGPDALRGGPGADVLRGRAGGDDLGGGPGDDRLLAGSGGDTARFSRSRKRIVASLASGTADGEGADTLSGVEHLVGSKRGDRLEGSGAANRLVGGPGADTIRGGPGADILVGGPGGDTVRGGPGADTLVGGPGGDALLGEAGGDRFDEGPTADGADAIRGGPGRDLVTYARRRARIVVVLDATARDGARGERDLVDRTVEDVEGGRGADLLVGDGGRNHLRGGGGDDRLRGLRGRDVLLGGPGADRLHGGPGADRCRGGPGSDEEVACER